MSKPLIPQIRFSGFEEEWVQAPFEEVAHRQASISYDERVPSIEYEDINSQKGTLNKDVYRKSIHKVGQRFSKGDLLFGKLRPYLGNNLLAEFDGIAVGDFWIFRDGLATTRFIYPFLYTKDFSYISNMSSGSKMPRSDWGLVSQWHFNIPSKKSEQEKIGEYFKLMEEMMAKAEREVERLEKMKQASLQKMFPRPGETVPEIRFAGFEGEWEAVTLSSIVGRVTRKNGNESQLALTISSLLGLVDQETYFNHRVASKDVSNYILIRKGEFAYNKSSSEGFPWGSVRRLDRYDKGVLSNLYIVFSISSSSVNSEYLRVYFDTTLWHDFLSITAAEGARNHGLLNISAESFMELSILLPSHAEQKAIGEYFRSLDELIAEKRKKIVKLRNIKKACLDRMFVNTTE